MKTFIQSGDMLTLPAPYARSSGQGAQIGQIFAIAANDYANAEVGEWKPNGVFEITKIGSQAWTLGALVYWDNTNKRCTTSASGNLLIGAAAHLAIGAGAGETTGYVRLNGTVRPNEA